MLKGQNGAKGMWRRISPYERSDGLWHKRVQQLPIFSNFFQYDLSNKLIRALLFLHKDKTKQSHISIDLKKDKTKQKKAISSASTGEIWLIPEDFDSRVICSPVLPMSVVGYRCELSAQGDCDVGVESPPGHQGGVV